LALWVYGTLLAQSACQSAVITALLGVREAGGFASAAAGVVVRQCGQGGAGSYPGRGECMFCGAAGLDAQLVAGA
jgi:hypothetical protein